MRVLFFSRDYTTHDWRFLNSLAKSEHEIFYLRLENVDVAYEQRSLPDNIQRVEWAGGHGPAPDPGAWLSLMPALESVVTEIRPDLIHAGPVVSCAFMSALLDFHPLLVMSWGSDILFSAEHDVLMRWMARFTLQKCDGLFGDCQAVIDKAREIAGVLPPSSLQFPWGISLGDYKYSQSRQEMRKALGWDDAFVVNSPRAWEDIYGIDTLLEGFRLAFAEQPRLRLLMPGAGRRAPDVRQFISRYGLERIVHTPGIIDHNLFVASLDASDLYVSCALSDGSSISLLEAMAMRLPAIVTNIPSNREWITPNSNGWLVPPGDSKALASTILTAFTSSSGTLMNMGDRSRAIVEMRAQWEDNFPKLLTLYQLLHNTVHDVRRPL